MAWEEEAVETLVERAQELSVATGVPASVLLRQAGAWVEDESEDEE